MTQKTAWVFPGQGSQSLGMLAQHEDHPEVVACFDEASEVLGYDLWALCQKDEAKLNQTEYTQPALLTASVAMGRMHREAHTQPDYLAGHSLGEYTALVCAGALAFDDAVKLVSLRGQFMQAAVEPGVGAMAAVLGLEDTVVKSICTDQANGEVLSPVNFNSIGQVVVAGHTAAVERAMEAAKDAGARKVVLLPVSVPSHCALMQPAAENLAEVLADVEIRTPMIPVIHNVDVEFHDDADSIKQALIAQLSQPVRWVETIQKMAELGVGAVLECGPGKVLSGLNKRIDKLLEYGQIG